MHSKRTQQKAVSIVDLMHISKEFRTNYINNKKGENWTRLEHHQVSIEGASQVIWLKIQENDRKKNEVQATVVTSGKIQQVTLITKRAG